MTPFSVFIKFSIDKPQRGKKISPPSPLQTKTFMDTLVPLG